MSLYVVEERVWVGIAGARPEEPNAAVRIEVHSASSWTGTLELDDNFRIPDKGVLHIGHEGYAYQVTGKDGPTYQIEKGAASRPSPGQEQIRTASGTVEIIGNSQVVGLGRAEVRVYNDDAWIATISLEGDSPPPQHLAAYNVRAIGSDLVTAGIVEGTGWSLKGGGDDAITVKMVSWKDSPPPL